MNFTSQNETPFKPRNTLTILICTPHKSSIHPKSRAINPNLSTKTQKSEIERIPIDSKTPGVQHPSTPTRLPTLASTHVGHA